MPTLTVIVEQLLAPIPGGTGRYAREITTAIAAHPRPGWRVRTVTAWHRAVQSAVIPGVAGPYRLPAGHRLLSELWLRALPPTVGGDRVQATTPLAPHRGQGLMVTVHDAVPWTHPETLTQRGVAWHRTMVGRAVNHAEAIVVPSIAVADDLAGLFPSASNRIHVIGHGVTVMKPPADAERRRRRWGLPERYVLSVATLEPRKGLDVLVAAMALPAARQAHLVVVGSPGWGGIDIGAVAALAGLPPERLHLLGRVDDDDLAAVLAGAAVLAAPSRSEGFGLPVLEAMAAGVPVVSSDAPALVELAGGVSLVVPREDAEALAGALGEVLGDDSLAADLAGRGQQRAQAYSWSSAAARWWDLHEGQRAAHG